jgi:hypothetical protein
MTAASAVRPAMNRTFSDGRRIRRPPVGVTVQH